MKHANLSLPPDYGRVTQELAQAFYEDEVRPNPLLDTMTPAQIGMIKDILHASFAEALQTGLALGCDHPELTREPTTDELAFEAALDVSEIDGFHRGYITAHTKHYEGEA